MNKTYSNQNSNQKFGGAKRGLSTQNEKPAILVMSEWNGKETHNERNSFFTTVRRQPNPKIADSFTCGWRFEGLEQYHVTLTRLGHSDWFPQSEIESLFLQKLNLPTRFRVLRHEIWYGKYMLILGFVSQNVRDIVGDIHDEYGVIESTGKFYPSQGREFHIKMWENQKKWNSIKDGTILSAMSLFIKPEGEGRPAVFELNLPM